MSGAPARLRQRPLLLAEALAALILASAAIRLLPFRTLAGALTGRADKPRPPATPTEAAWIARALRAWAPHVPWRTLCFEQGVAAHMMLRRRRRAATLYYGAAHAGNAALVAHVWVRSGPVDVVGCEIAADFRLIARFPAEGD